MTKLTKEELNNIFSWQPYQKDWPINRNQTDDSIDVYYGELIKNFTHNKSFDCQYSEDGGLGNYLEFMCYPNGHTIFKGHAILVCISLCAPIAAYGQIEFHKGADFIGWSGIFAAEAMGLIDDSALLEIETEVKAILTKQSLLLLDKDFACTPLPNEITESLKNENHNDGNQYLHGIFQKNE